MTLNKTMYGISFASVALLMGVGCGGSDDTTSISATETMTSTDTKDTEDTDTMTTSDTESTGTETDSGTDTEQNLVALVWDIEGLVDLGPNFVYEGWLLIDGAPVSAGRFTVDGNGTPSLTGAKVSQEQPESATKFILSIELEPDSDPGPSDTKLIAGDFVDMSANLGISDVAALGNDFGSASGQYILYTPSTEISEDYAQGIWWFDLNADPPTSSLVLPSLPAGWQYEGWVELGENISSTGRFTDLNAADSDGAGSAKGPGEDLPNFPGQDFIDPELNLITGVTVISIEPEPDNSLDRFLPLEVLRDRPIENTMEGELQAMETIKVDDVVTGTAHFE